VYLLFIDLLTVCVAMNLELLLLSCDYDEDMWCVAVQKDLYCSGQRKKAKEE